MKSALEIWGGIECSIVRVGDSVRNQLHDTGHYFRRNDIRQVAELGVKILRYPVLWEMVEQHEGKFDWRWTEERLGELQKHGIAPIAGLIHHGSGPAWTDWSDPQMPEKLARYARLVAERHPWIRMFTPVNEPFTTARICGLYGQWSPHTYDEKTCFRITVAECRAISLAMKAIREITPDAKLIQTEDFGRVYSTTFLAAQADYENERRWLSVDLLTGRVGPSHPLHRRLIEAGVDQGHLSELVAEPCAPDIIGIDYYLTSDRVLDHRLELHAAEPVGGNGRQSYVDVAAVRSDLPQDHSGLAGRLAEVWDRYGLPIAVTELHNGCTRDEHVRWLMEGWNTAVTARHSGIDIRAITSWSMFGAMDWNSMMTRQDNYYECGAFDARYNPPQPTIVGQAIAHLALAGRFDHPVLDRPGWWHARETSGEAARPLVLVGFERLTPDIQECCNRRRLRVLPAGSVRDPDVLFKRHNAWAVVTLEHRQTGNTARDMKAPVRLHCIYSGGEETLSLDLPHNADWRAFVDTFLDLIIDGRVGRLRCISTAHSTVRNALVERVPEFETEGFRASGAA